MAPTTKSVYTVYFQCPSIVSVLGGITESDSPHYTHTHTNTKCVITHHKLKSSTVNLWQKQENRVLFLLVLSPPVILCMNYVGVLFVVCRCKCVCVCVGLRTSLISELIVVGRPAGFLSDNGNASPHTHTLIFYIPYTQSRPLHLTDISVRVKRVCMCDFSFSIFRSLSFPEIKRSLWAVNSSRFT